MSELNKIIKDIEKCLKELDEHCSECSKQKVTDSVFDKFVCEKCRILKVREKLASIIGEYKELVLGV